MGVDAHTLNLWIFVDLAGLSKVEQSGNAHAV